MKKTLLTFTGLALAIMPLVSIGQITIENYDFRLPVAPDTAYLQVVAAGSSTVTPGTNATWDLSGVFGGANFDFALEAVNDPNHPNAQGRRESPANLGNGVFLDQFYNYYGVNGNSYSETGFEIEGKGFSIGNLTGDANDSIITMDTIFNYDAKILQFPATMGDNWTSSFHIWVPFTITVESAAWYGDTIALRQDIVRNDTVKGWGTLILPTGESMDVILVESTGYRVDSAYFNGAPMNPILAQQFGFTQNDTLRFNTVAFYTKGLNYSAYEYTEFDGMQGTPTFYRTSNIGVAEEAALPLIVYPNPANDVIELMGNVDGEVQILNLNGQVVLQEDIESATQTARMDVSSLASGVYLLRTANQTVRVTIE
ncbi:MAG: T9SS type A sorting domain-containing protein [Flavobacteriia bacterium]|nr:T9SS type A sorting domain-containing protein [Flavobacteriia bacterium]